MSFTPSFHYCTSRAARPTHRRSRYNFLLYDVLKIDVRLCCHGTSEARAHVAFRSPSNYTFYDDF
jgi:hypothetical protein